MVHTVFMGSKATLLISLYSVISSAAVFVMAVMVIQQKKNQRIFRKQWLQSEKMASLGKLIASFSHDINTKIGVCVSAVSFLRDSSRTVRKSIAANDITKSQLEKHLADEVDSLDITLLNLQETANLVISMKTISGDQARSEAEEIRMKDYIDQILLSMSPKLRKTGHNIVSVCAEDLRITIIPGTLSQIISNLIENSLVHAFGNEDRGTMEIRVNIRGKDIILTFSDDGKGMDKNVKSQIFKPFYTTRKTRGGTGLGLSIVHDIVTKELKGSIICDSEPEKGTSFFIRIPDCNPKNEEAKTE